LRHSITADSICDRAGRPKPHRHKLSSGTLRRIVTARDYKRATKAALLRHVRAGGGKLAEVIECRCENRLKKTGWDTGSYIWTATYLRDLGLRYVRR
jgi:hypothetical protein